jgi:DNA-binding transcriptional MocR family regulator
VESPAYFGTLQVIQALGLRALEIPTDSREGIDPDALDAALRRRRVAAVVVTPNGHNPLGVVLGEERRRRLAAVLAAHGVPALEDETYAELHHAPVRPPSLRAYARTAPVLSCGSFSKTLASGYRVGWIVPGPLRSAVLQLKAATTVATSMPAQLAVAEFLRVGGYDHHLRRLRARLERNVDRVRAEVLDHFPAGTRVSSPQSGFLLWVELPEAVDARAVYGRCLARGVSVAPGPIFSAVGAYRHFLRLNAGLLWSDELGRALRVVADDVRAGRRASA